MFFTSERFDGPYAGIVDSTNPNARDWFISQLNYAKQMYGINSFKFDYGEVVNLPKDFQLYNYTISPNDYSEKYARMAFKMGNMIEVRVGSQTQDLPVFVRMGDRDSIWTIDNGLQSVLTATLTFGIIGYPFVLPDIIA